MNRIILLAFCTMLFALCGSAHAQQPKKVPRVGYLSPFDAATESARSEPYRRALRGLGYIEGQNITIEYRYAEGKDDRLPALSAELVRLKVDVIVVAGGGEPLIRAALNATKTIPIVLTGGGADPVEGGYVESIARPGSNVTGLTFLNRELGGKRLELLKEAVPKLDRVAGRSAGAAAGEVRVRDQSQNGERDRRYHSAEGASESGSGDQMRLFTGKRWVIAEVVVLCAMLFALCVPAEAQQSSKVPRIGYLAGSSSANPVRIEAFRQGLRKLGYVEGKNIVIDWRYAEGKSDRLPGFAAELVHLNVDAIVTSAPSQTRAAKEATVTIPIVMALDNDPVGNGFVVSLARPGGNITGLSTLAPEISGKQVELLTEIVPRISRVAVLGTSTNPGNAQALKESQLTAGVYKVQLQFLDVLDPKDIESAFRAASKGRAEAVLVLGSPVFISHRPRVVDLAVKNRLPTVYWTSEFVKDGGLMTYSVSSTDLYRRAATYVDKILRGAKPADLPVERPQKFEFIISLKAAKQIGLTIPPNVLARADKVIR